MQSFAELGKALQTDLSNFDYPFITSDMSVDAVRAISLRSSFFKKFAESTSPEADNLCLSLFEQSNEKCKVFALEASRLFHDEVIGEVKHILDDIFYNGPDHAVSFSDLEEHINVGPGASIGASSFNFYSKLFDSPLTYTNGQLPYLYTRAIRCNSTWADAERLRSQKFGFTRVEGNRLSFVPKTTSISRSICTEPSLNMLFQKGLGLVFEQLLRRHFKIDLSVQPELNKNLARLGSQFGAFGTIDLKSASDSISLNLLKEILPKYVYDWLCLFRSPTVTFPDGSSRELHMVSSMGNGFTFPLQTLIFATIVRACYRVLGIKFSFRDNKPSNFGIFGDDIIVERQAYDFVTECLALFGFTVNNEKSFNVGTFRESCGGDYYKGSDVRGVYVKKLSSKAEVYSTINRLVRWCSVSGIMLPEVLRQLSGSVRELPVPYHAGDTEGVKVPFRFLKSFSCDETGCIRYKALRPVTTSFEAPTDESGRGRFYPGKRKRLIGFNAPGLAVAFVGGYIRDGRITLRNDEEVRRYKVQACKTPHWDYYDSAASKMLVRDWEVMYELLAQSCLSYSRD